MDLAKKTSPVIRLVGTEIDEDGHSKSPSAGETGREDVKGHPKMVDESRSGCGAVGIKVEVFQLEPVEQPPSRMFWRG